MGVAVSKSSTYEIKIVGTLTREDDLLSIADVNSAFYKWSADRTSDMVRFWMDSVERPIHHPTPQNVEPGFIISGGIVPGDHASTRVEAQDALDTLVAHLMEHLERTDIFAGLNGELSHYRRVRS